MHLRALSTLASYLLVTAMFGTVASPAAAKDTSSEAISSETCRVIGEVTLYPADESDKLGGGYAYFASELVGDYEKLTNILVSFHDEKGEVIGKCVADSAAVKCGNVELGCELAGWRRGIQDAADSVVAFLISDQGVEVFYVFDDYPDTGDLAKMKDHHYFYQPFDPDNVPLELQNVTATELQDLWAWSPYGNIALWGSGLDWVGGGEKVW